MRCPQCGALAADDKNHCDICHAEFENTGEAGRSAAREAATSAGAPAEVRAPGPGPEEPASPETGPGLLRRGVLYAGRYRVEGFLGTGSVGSTYAVLDEGRDGAEAVLKVLLPRKAEDPALSEAFLLVAASMARHDHPRIVKVLGSGREGGSAHLAMERLHGPTFRYWLLDRLSFGRRVGPGIDHLLRLLEAFAEIHETGCYGSLKPENVFITAEGPVLTDFGAVGLLTPEEFEFSAYARRYLPYMAPEIRQDWGNIMPQSDLYSLGALTYEVLTGKPPAGRVEMPSVLADRFGVEVDEFILKALASSPQARYQSAGEMRQALLAVRDSLPREPAEAAPAVPKPFRAALSPRPAAAPGAPFSAEAMPSSAEAAPRPQAWAGVAPHPEAWDSAAPTAANPTADLPGGGPFADTPAAPPGAPEAFPVARRPAFPATEPVPVLSRIDGIPALPDSDSPGAPEDSSTLRDPSDRARLDSLAALDAPDRIPDLVWFLLALFGLLLVAGAALLGMRF